MSSSIKHHQTAICSTESIVSSVIAPVPIIAKGYEEIYQRFLKGVLIYRPQEGSDIGRIDMPIAELKNPLDGTFDLSRCGNAAKYLSISTGYCKGEKSKNSSKIEIWIAPRFLINQELETTARHFKAIEGKWASDASVGVFWNWGNNEDLSQYDYLTSQNMESLSKSDLYGNWLRGDKGDKYGVLYWWSKEDAVYEDYVTNVRNISIVFPDLKMMHD